VESIIAQTRFQNIPVCFVSSRVGQPFAQLPEVVGDFPLVEIVGDVLPMFPAVAEELCFVEVGEFLIALEE